MVGNTILVAVQNAALGVYSGVGRGVRLFVEGI